MIINMPWLIRKPDYSGSRNYVKIFHFSLWVITLCVIIPLMAAILVGCLVVWLFKLHVDEDGKSIHSHIELPQFLWNEDHYLIAYHTTMGFNEAKDFWYKDTPTV